MTRDEILKMEAGRKMDIRIAENVFAMKRTADDVLENDIYIWRDWEVPHYSEDIEDAWNVLEKQHPLAEFMAVEYREYSWRCQITKYSVTYIGIAETAPMAICRAALLAECLEVKTHPFDDGLDDSIIGALP